MQEFYLPQYHDLIENYTEISDKLATGLHEVIGHASGKIEPGVESLTSTLKNYASALEEARVDLVALYYIAEPYLKELGLVTDTEKVMQIEYISYITKGLFRQLVRIEPGKDIEEAHMRNRQMIAQWVFEHGQQEQVIVKKLVDGKTFFVINDFKKLRGLFGQLLREVQRIKSQGDYEAGKKLIETYGVKVDQVLHKEVLERWKKLNMVPYSGFINPVLKAIKNSKGEISDV